MSKILNLDLPIFVFYVNVEGLSKEKANEYLRVISKAFEFENVTMWIIACDKTEVKCIYPGKENLVGVDITENLEEVIRHVNDRIEILSDSNSYEDFKINMRNWKIDKIV